MGINGKAFAYIEQFVTNRTMQVRVGSELSVTHYLENGTPQGSIISPLLFLIMINDLPNDITETEIVDDSCLFKSGRNVDFILHKMQTSLNKLVERCDLNGFKISTEKTVAVLYSPTGSRRWYLKDKWQSCKGIAYRPRAREPNSGHYNK